MKIDDRIVALLQNARSAGVEARCIYIGREEARELLTQKGNVAWGFSENHDGDFPLEFMGIALYVVNERSHLNVSGMAPSIDG